MGKKINLVHKLKSAYEKFVNRNTRSELLNFDFEPINSARQLSMTLQKLASAALKETKAFGVEICLYDKDSGRYHQSIVVGKPFRDPIDEALKNSPKTEDGFCLVELVHFAGVMVGAVRCSFRNSPDEELRDYVKLLVQQVNLAVVNHNFVAEMQKAQKSSQESLRAKTGFLASLSHELRGPLGVILNATEIVKDELAGSVNDQQKEMLSMVLKNGEHLLDLLNDVLDYARIESGKITADKAVLEVPAALQELLNVVRVQAHTKKQKLELICDTTSTLTCDRRHFRQILINLLTNAIKYTPDGGTIQVVVDPIHGGKIKISVVDSGCGIAPEDKHKVFSPFERIEKGYAASQSGTGLGLSLTQKLVQLNGGFIDFDSRIGAGSTFSVTLNMASESEKPQTKETLENELKDISGNGAEIIFVSDDSSESKMICDYLRKKNFVVHRFSEKNIQDQKDLALILVDDSALKLFPEDIASHIRRTLSLYSIPLILLSNKAFSFEVEDKIRSGVDRFVAKPIALGQIARIIVETIQSSSRTKKDLEKTVH